MKKLFSILLALFLISTITCVCACTNPQGGNLSNQKVTITFVQEGQENIVYTINKGETLINVPDPVEVVGYEVVWNVENFTNIQKDMTVGITKTPKTYVITFTETLSKNGYTVSITTKQISVKYLENIANKLPTDPTCYKQGESYDFKCWVKKDGSKFDLETFNIAEDITLYATFDIQFA